MSLKVGITILLALSLAGGAVVGVIVWLFVRSTS